MSYVTYKNRSSSNYRFTTVDLNDPSIDDLKTMIKKLNDNAKYSRELQKQRFGEIKYPRPSFGIRIRPRGPRVGGFNYYGTYYDTPMENATHYDVYIREY